MSVIRFDSVEDLVQKANDTIYGLAAGVVKKDIDKTLYVANNIRAGTVWYKMSGFGRELGEYGLEAYTK